MQVKVFGPMAGPGPMGNIVSWAPNAVVDVDDDDEAAVAFYRGFAEAGVAEILEEPVAPAPAKAKASKAELEAEASAVRAALDAAANEPPPMGGPGSSREAWADYAASQGVEVTEDMTRDDIVEAIEDKS